MGECVDASRSVQAPGRRGPPGSLFTTNTAPPGSGPTVAAVAASAGTLTWPRCGGMGPIGVGAGAVTLARSCQEALLRRCEPPAPLAATGSVLPGCPRAGGEVLTRAGVAREEQAVAERDLAGRVGRDRQPPFQLPADHGVVM